MECENWQNTHTHKKKFSKAIYNTIDMSISMPLGCTKVIDTDLLRVILNNDRNEYRWTHTHRAVFISHFFIVAVPIYLCAESDTH